jgi:pyruvate/2-oxoglutarate dehydrogenase complex dihydrolipoamide dehydrogenase (E3) component
MIRAADLLVATGRTANLTHMGVESVGIDRTEWLPVDEQHKADLQS